MQSARVHQAQGRRAAYQRTMAPLMKNARKALAHTQATSPPGHNVAARPPTGGPLLPLGAKFVDVNLRACTLRVMTQLILLKREKPQSQPANDRLATRDLPIFLGGRLRAMKHTHYAVRASTSCPKDLPGTSEGQVGCRSRTDGCKPSRNGFQTLTLDAAMALHQASSSQPATPTRRSNCACYDQVAFASKGQACACNDELRGVCPGSRCLRGHAATS